MPTPESCGFSFSQFFGGVITAAIGGIIGFLSARRISAFNVRQQAASNLRASFAPQLAYLKSVEGYTAGTEEIRERLHSVFVSIHAAELEKFRFFVKCKNIETYDKACERYEELLHPGFLVNVGKQNPSEFFISHIRALLNRVSKL